MTLNVIDHPSTFDILLFKYISFKTQDLEDESMSFGFRPISSHTHIQKYDSGTFSAL